jgi:hypothetical protein
LILTNGEIFAGWPLGVSPENPSCYLW